MSSIQRIKNHYFEQLPSSDLIPLIKDCWKEWPCHQAQEELLNCFDPLKNTFIIEDQDEIPNLVPPVSYRRHLLKLLEKDILSYSITSDEEPISDTFMEELSKVMMSKLADEDPGFLSYTTPDIEPKRVPIFIKKSHNQVGTKVWSAGLYLVEFFHALSKECGQALINWKDKTVLELGSGVGITGVLLGEGVNQIPLKKIVMSDLPPEVLQVLDYNVKILPSPSIEKYSVYPLDWTQLGEFEDSLLRDSSFLFAADCTYSEDLNSALLILFERYFQLRLTSINKDINDYLSLLQSETFSLLSYLQSDLPLVFLACTIRNPTTYQHLQNTLAGSNLIKVIDITTNPQINIECLYKYPFRENIHLLCILPNSHKV